MFIPIRYVEITFFITLFTQHYNIIHTTNRQVLYHNVSVSETPLNNVKKKWLEWQGMYLV